MNKTPSQYQNAQLEKLWMRSHEGDVSAIKLLQQYYAPKLTVLAFGYLEDPKASKRIVKQVILETLSCWEDGIADLGEFMMHLVIEKAKRHKDKKTENNS